MRSTRLVLVTMAALAILASSAFAQKMCIDPGHGGTDPGATGGGLTEKAVNLDVGNKLRAWYVADNADSSGGRTTWNAIRTRSTDITLSLGGRTTYANNNGADRFLSTHANAFNSAANGIETFCYTSGSSNSFALRNLVYDEAVAMWPLTRRGRKVANFYVLRYTNMPAELHEMGFIDSSVDRVYIGNATHRNNQALSQLYASQRHYGTAKHKPGQTVIITRDNSHSTFSASSNWGTGSWGNPYGADYRWRGTASASDAAQWMIGTISTPGNYRVQAWWVEGANRATAAPYIIQRGDTTVTTVNVNQRATGGTFRTIATLYFWQGNNRNIKLSCWTSSGDVVIADAVRIRND